MNSRQVLMTTATVSLLIIVALMAVAFNFQSSPNPDKGNDVVDKGEDKPNDSGNVNTPKYISCSTSEYIPDLKSLVETTISINFNDNNFVDTSVMTMKYIYDLQEDYDMWKQTYLNQPEISIPGVVSRTEFDDSTRTMTSIMEQDYSEIPAENINDEFPNEYNAAKQYFQDAGYTCNF